MDSSTKKGFLLGIGLMALLFMAFLAGGYFQGNKNENVGAKQGVQVAPSTSTAIPKDTNATSAPAASDSRQLISSQTEYEQKVILDTFLGKFNTSPATTTFIYNNIQKGIEVLLPWNPLWGTKDHKIAQYEMVKNSSEIRFGFMDVCGEGAGCLWRQFSLTFLPAKTLAEEKKDRISTDTVAQEVLNINGMTVLNVADEGLCAAHTLTVIGKKYNYDFSSACGLSEEGLAQLKKIIATMKFV